MNARTAFHGISRLFTQSRLAVAGLGVTQIIGYGTLYYSFSILAPSMGADYDLASDWLFGAFSASLLVSGLASPWVGRWIDRYGAGAIMAPGSVAAAAALVLCAHSASIPTFFIGLVAIHLASTFVLYNAAFALLVQMDPETARIRITHLTLIAGFASTILWPVTTELHAYLSWREVYDVFAAANIMVCLPVHLWLAMLSRGQSRLANRTMASTVEPILSSEHIRTGFILMVCGFAFLGFVNAAILIHMLPILAALGLGGVSVLVGTLFGPAQVASRLISLLSGNKLRPLALAFISTGLMSGAVALLLWSGSTLAGAVAFAILFGLGSGLSSIAQGTLPLALFGSHGYGERIGKSTAVRLIASSAAPFVFAFILHRAGISLSLTICVGFGMMAGVSFALIARLRRRQDETARVQQ
jgi:MFS family permease